MNNNAKPLNSILEIIPKLANYGVGLTVLCYVAGFIITNMYLGSLGIINFDILRTKYILVGLLFLLFLISLYFLSHGLLLTLRKNIDAPTRIKVNSVIKNSITNIVYLYTAIYAIQIFSGINDFSRVFISNIFPKLSFFDWITSNIRLILGQAAFFFISTLLAITILVLVILMINPKDRDGLIVPRILRFKNLIRSLMEIKILTYIFYYSIISILIFAIPNYLVFLTTNGIRSTSPSFGFFLHGGWARYFISIIILYFIIANFITNREVFQKSDDLVQTPISNNPLADVLSYISIVSILIIIIIPIYTYVIYPHIPQQIGGGQLLHVEALISEDLLNEKFSKSNNTSYLLDRTKDTSIFLLLDNSTQNYQIIEIPNSSMSAVIYNP